MRKWDMEVTNQSFDRAGITKDAQEAICEYIWNGFEANATRVSVEIIGQELEEARAIRVSDNGSGIDYDNLKDAFRPFLASPKPKGSIRIKAQANKGKGRFSYLAIASMATWQTVYNNALGETKKYMIQLNSAEKKHLKHRSQLMREKKKPVQW